MRRVVLPPLAAALLLLTCPGLVHGRTVTLSFDTDPAGAAIADGALVNDVYAPLGVVLERVGGDGGLCGSGSDVYANANQDQGGVFASAPNNVSICGALPSDFTSANGLIRAILDDEAIEACVVVNPEDNKSGLLQIIGGDGEVFATETSTPGTTETFCIRSDVPFRSVQFAGDGAFARFDDLRITFGPNRVDFDTLRDGSEIADGAIVDDLYIESGVRFSKVGADASCGDGFVYANGDQGAGPEPVGSAPNVVSVCRGGQFSNWNESSGSVRAEFVRQVSQVCIDAFPSGSQDVGVIQGFDALGQMVDDDSSTPGVPQQICVSALAMVAVEFGGVGPQGTRFDDLDFSFGAASLDFDLDPLDPLGQDTIASGSVVNTTYLASGVLLQRGETDPPFCGVGDEVYANEDVTGFASPPNQVSLCSAGFSDFSETREGTVRALFDSDARIVCIDVRATNASDFAVLRSFDVNDAPLDEVFSQAGATETLCIEGSSIRGVRFAGAGQRFARFDNLDVVLAPEPATALGILAVHACLAVLRSTRARPRQRRI